MIEPEWLESDAVLFLHDQALREYGGAQGLKEKGVLGSALGRPANRFGYAGDTLDLFDLAAAYAFGLACHAFNDANKRTAWGCCVLFLKVNGTDLAVPAADVVEQMLRLAQGELDEAAFAAWLRAHRRH